MSNNNYCSCIPANVVVCGQVDLSLHNFPSHIWRLWPGWSCSGWFDQVHLEVERHQLIFGNVLFDVAIRLERHNGPWQLYNYDVDVFNYYTAIRPLLIELFHTEWCDSNVLARTALEKAEVLLTMNHGMAHLDNIWGVGGGNRPVKYLTNKVPYLNTHVCVSHEIFCRIDIVHLRKWRSGAMSHYLSACGNHERFFTGCNSLSSCFALFRCVTASHINSCSHFTVSCIYCKNPTRFSSLS